MARRWCCDMPALAVFAAAVLWESSLLTAARGLAARNRWLVRLRSLGRDATRRAARSKRLRGVPTLRTQAGTRLVSHKHASALRVLLLVLLLVAHRSLTSHTKRLWQHFDRSPTESVTRGVSGSVSGRPPDTPSSSGAQAKFNRNLICLCTGRTAGAEECPNEGLS